MRSNGLWRSRRGLIGRSPRWLVPTVWRRTLLFTWRRQFLAAAVAGDSASAGFVPVRLTEEVSASPETMSPSPAVAPRLEIRLPSGIVINVIGEVASESLRQVLAALAAG